MGQTGWCPREESAGDWKKKVKKMAEEHICILHGHRQQFGKGQGRGWWGRMEVGKGGVEERFPQ